MESNWTLNHNKLVTRLPHTAPPNSEQVVTADGVRTYAKVLEQVLGLLVDLELAGLRGLGEVESRHLGDVLILALTLLLLELEGDTANGTLLDTLHQVGGVAGDLLFC